MKTYDIFKLSLSHVRKSKMRSWLTIVGIVIGVAAIVAIISIGEGMQASVQKSLGSLGADLITVSPGYSRATGMGDRHGPEGGGVSTVNLTDKDVNMIKQVPGIIYVNGMVSGRSDIILGNEKTSASISGIDTTVWRSIVTTELESGRYLQPGDSNAVVIGYSLAHDVFLQPITQNRPITIGGKIFKVVGIFAQSGGRYRTKTYDVPACKFKDKGFYRDCFCIDPGSNKQRHIGNNNVPWGNCGGFASCGRCGYSKYHVHVRYGTNETNWIAQSPGGN